MIMASEMYGYYGISIMYSRSLFETYLDLRNKYMIDIIKLRNKRG